MTKILFIEDNDDLRNETIDYLKFEGFYVIGVNGGQHGIELAQIHKPDLILCDILMKDLNGYEVRKRLKSIPETSMIPFIFLTALAENEDMRKGMELGADDYLIKPVSLEKLKNAIETRLEKSKEFDKYVKERMDELREKIIHALPHELLTPLNGILGFANLIKQNTDVLCAKEIKEMASSIEVSATRLHGLINNYLTYVAEVSKNRIISDKVIYSIKEVVTDISTNVANKFSRKEDLILDIDDAVLLMETGDLEFIIKELVDNAFKFSESGSNVIIKGRECDDIYEIIITDHGMGFPFNNNFLGELGVFNQFNRKKLEQQGSGLGLITSLLIIQRNDGTLNICNEEIGTSITVTLPTIYK
jgi:K+-sensing histidine kinase KdpD